MLDRLKKLLKRKTRDAVGPEAGAVTEAGALVDEMTRDTDGLISEITQNIEEDKRLRGADNKLAIEVAGMEADRHISRYFERTRNPKKQL